MIKNPAATSDRLLSNEILSESAEESLELAHIRTVLAATSNEAYNALVCTALAPEIGQNRVLQLALGGSDPEEDPKALARPRRGGSGVSRGRIL